ETEDGWVRLAPVGQRLANIASDFDPRTYGYRKFSDLVRNTGAFDINQPEGNAMRIRARPTQPPEIRAGATVAAPVPASWPIPDDALRLPLYRAVRLRSLNAASVRFRACSFFMM